MSEKNWGGKRSGAGAQPKSPHFQRVRCGDMTIPQWLHTWPKEQHEPGGRIIERTIIETFGLEALNRNVSPEIQPL